MIHVLKGVGVALMLWSCAPIIVAEPNFAPPLIANGHGRISTSAEMTQFLQTLVARNPEIATLNVAGKSVQGRPLEVLRLATGDVEETRKPRVMVIGSQHGAAEPAGGEALLIIALELAEGPLRPLLDDLDVLLIPNANPDGRDILRRANANGVNINTDFVLVSQPETRIMKEILHEYAPDAVLDSHESAVLKRKTLAREGYLTDFNAQFEYSNNPAVPAALRDFAAQTVLPAVTARVTEGGLPAHRYIGEIISTKQPITNGGLTLRNFRNTAGMTGALSLLVETKLDNKDDSYPTYRNIAVRVERQLLCIRSFLREMHVRRDAIMEITNAARLALPKEPVTMYAGYVKDEANPTVKIPMRKLDSRERVELEFRDHRAIVTDDTVPYPPMMVVTANMDKLRPLLERHGINYWSLTQPTAATVIANRFEGRANIYDRVKVLEEARREVPVEPGSLFIDLNQPHGRLALLLLDPRSTSSVFRYPEYAQLVDATREFFVYRTFKGAIRSQP